MASTRAARRRQTVAVRTVKRRSSSGPAGPGGLLGALLRLVEALPACLGELLQSLGRFLASLLGRIRRACRPSGTARRAQRVVVRVRSR